MILDENSAYETANNIQIQSVFEQIIELSNVGATFDLLLLNEITDADIKDYKLFVFTNPVVESFEYKTLKNKINNAGKYMIVSGESDDSIAVKIGLETLIKKAEEAGVFLYSKGNIVFNNDEYLCVTATKDMGFINLRLPDDRKLLNLITGEELDPVDRKLQIKADFNDSFLFKMI